MCNSIQSSGFAKNNWQPPDSLFHQFSLTHLVQSRSHFKQKHVLIQDFQPYDTNNTAYATCTKWKNQKKSKNVWTREAHFAPSGIRQICIKTGNINDILTTDSHSSRLQKIKKKFGSMKTHIKCTSCWISAWLVHLLTISRYETKSNTQVQNQADKLCHSAPICQLAVHI